MNNVNANDENENPSITIECSESIMIEKLKAIHGQDDPRFNVEQSAWKRPLKWSNIIILSILHIAVIVCYVDVCISLFHLETAIFSIIIGAMSGIATSAGAHRLWSHRSYKARWPLKLWFLIFQAITMNGSALTYARDHRTHHKYSDTDGDPKNHVFPFDYRINDRPQWELFNPPVSCIRICSLIGLAYDLKIASPEVVKGTVARKGCQALYDSIRSMKFRIVNAIFDWIIGISIALWIIYPALFYKLFTQPVIYI